MLDQARSAARVAGLGVTATDEVLAVAHSAIDTAEEEGLVVQQIVRRVADCVLEHLGASREFDVYAEVKRRSNELALAHLHKMRCHVAESRDRLGAAVQVAAAGNIIDFGAKSHATLDVAGEIERLTEAGFARYDMVALRDALARASSLLYLCDNAGEIVFDALLLEELQRLAPALAITAAVRHLPVINDATLADAEVAGLSAFGDVISSGSVYPGTILEETSPEFRERFDSADVILSKGQGNFETLLPVADERVFFLLRIKCEHMSSVAGVSAGNLVLMQGSGFLRG